MRNSFISGCFGFASFGSIRVPKPKTDSDTKQGFRNCKISWNCNKNNTISVIAKNRFNLDFNWKFETVRGTHCPSWEDFMSSFCASRFTPIFLAQCVEQWFLTFLLCGPLKVKIISMDPYYWGPLNSCKRSVNGYSILLFWSSRTP